MILLITKFFEYLNHWSNLGLIIVGTFALVVYMLQKQDQVRSTATLLKSQIDSVENVVKELKAYNQLSNEIIYKSRVILSRNYWEESRHLLIKKLGVDGVNLLEEFYRQAEQLEKSRAAICHGLVTAWKHKDRIIQEKYYEFTGDLDEEEKRKIHTNITNFNKNEDIFAPHLPIDILVKNLINFRLISGTTVYDKLSKMSYYRR